MADPFERILGQPKVRQFLRSSVASGRVSQAYLFTGLAGSNKTLAAFALAQALLCEQGGCGSCDTCTRVLRRTHPDVHFYQPEGAAGYLVSQMREIIGDVSLAPIQASRKVYIIDRADLMGAAAANAFLKTLEEPPDDGVFVLMGRTQQSMLPTIVSRCQVVPFRPIPAREAIGIVSQHTGVSPLQAAVGIQASSGSVSGAIDFVRSSERFEFRARVIEVLQLLALADDMDVLGYATELLTRSQAPLDAVRAQQSDELSASADFLARSALSKMEERHKRALSAKTTETLHQLTAIMRSWLRDVLMVASGTPDLVINTDYYEGIAQAAQAAQLDAIVRALAAPDACDDAIRYNVSPETCIDVLLFTIREELYGSDSAS